MTTDMVLVSACLLGIHCRYDGTSHEHPEALRLARCGRALPVCPEQLGGMPTPRSPVELQNGRIKDRQGNDHTRAFMHGAREALHLAELAGCRKALLQPRSPSCGCGFIYDGTFSGKLIPGNGILAGLLREQGIVVKPAD